MNAKVRNPILKKFIEKTRMDIKCSISTDWPHSVFSPVAEYNLKAELRSKYSESAYRNNFHRIIAVMSAYERIILHEVVESCDTK